MKHVIRLVCCLLLCAVLLGTLTACDLSGIISLDGKKSGGEEKTPGGKKEPFVPKEITEYTPVAFEKDYADQLSPNEKAIYDAVLAGKPGQNVFSVVFPEPMELYRDSAMTQEQQNEAQNRINQWLTNALSAVRLGAPEVFWLQTGTFRFDASTEKDSSGVYGIHRITATVALENNDTTTENTGEDEEYARLDRLYKGVLASAVVTGDTVAEKVASINKFLCDTVSYETDAPHAASVIGALVDGKAVCEGYAQAFALLCRRENIPCVSIVGDGVTSDGIEAHMWSAVQIDGVFYGVDVTWDDTTGVEDAYLLVGNDSVFVGKTFAASHLPRNVLGVSKSFALPEICPYSYEEMQQAKSES